MIIVATVLIILAVIYWAIKDYWQEMAGFHDLEDSR